jgi:hypothetical protein
MRAKRIDRIAGTARQKPARSSKVWGKRQLIAANERDEDLRCHKSDSPRRFKVVWKSEAIDDALAVAAAALAITTTSDGADGPAAVLKTSRISRLALFLKTAPPTFRLATIPSLEVPAAPGAATIVR